VSPHTHTENNLGASSVLVAPTVNTRLMSEHSRMVSEENVGKVHITLVLDGATRPE
jgi:hypothetical protein